MLLRPACTTHGQNHEPRKKKDSKLTIIWYLLRPGSVWMSNVDVVVTSPLLGSIVNLFKEPDSIL